jgi:fumarate reductase subunit C
VLAAAVHAPIGLRAVLLEWFQWKGRARDGFVLGFAVVLCWMGMRAVLAVFA